MPRLLGFAVHAHMLRHACGFKMANNGIDARTIQASLGHRDIRHTVQLHRAFTGKIRGSGKTDGGGGRFSAGAIGISARTQPGWPSIFVVGLIIAILRACPGWSRSAGSVHEGHHLFHGEDTVFVGVHCLEDFFVSRQKLLQ
jgi:hypothetical protein